jgi:hypothetical protein
MLDFPALGTLGIIVLNAIREKMATGLDLIRRIGTHVSLFRIRACPTVPVKISEAIYGRTMNDQNEVVLKAGSVTDSDLWHAIAFGGANFETAVWHFSVACDSRDNNRPAVHHFVVVPWYRHTPPHGQVYTVFMAYEDKYDIEDYVGSLRGSMSQSLGSGYKEAWTPSDLLVMLKRLLNKEATAYADYFLYGANETVASITYCKWGIITLDKAISNLTKFR